MYYSEAIELVKHSSTKSDKAMSNKLSQLKEFTTLWGLNTGDYHGNKELLYP